MYYDEQRKLAFVMPSKTGSTALEHFFKLWGVQSLSTNRHMFYDEAINAKPELATYKTYGFFRDPLDRFLSICRYIYIMNLHEDSEGNGYPDNIYDRYLDTFPNKLLPQSYLGAKQVAWLKNAELLDYRNYEMEILKVARMFEQTKVTMVKANETPPCDVVPSQRVIDFVQSYYADDYRLAKERRLG